MFHKPDSSVLSKNKKSMDVPLRKSDRRSLRNVAQELFSSSHQDLLDAVFLQGTLVCRKIAFPKMKLYYRGPSEDNEDSLWPYRTTTQCVWMTADKGLNCEVHAPTVALLSVLPTFPTVVVGFQVSKFLCRGADLMRAGIMSIPTTTTTESIVAIAVYGNPQPFAVGRLNAAPGEGGVGVHVWTCYGDDLWKQSQSRRQDHGVLNPMGGAYFDNGHYGNVGFLDGKIVKPIVTVEEEGSDEQEQQEETVTEASNEISEVAHEDPKEGESDSTPSKTASVVGESDADQETDEDALNDAQENEAKDDSTEISHDAVLHQAFCNALVNIKDSDLPMTMENLYAQHVIPHRPPDSTIQLKSTKWKKFGPYLEEQKSRDLIAVKPNGTNKTGYLTGIERSHPDLRGIRKDQAQEVSEHKKLTVVSLNIIPHHFVSLLRLDPNVVKATTAKSEERRGTGMLTVPEARAILDQYIQDNELSVSSSLVQLDGALTEALYKKQDAPETISRKDLAQKWIGKMEPAHALVEMPGSRILALRRGQAAKVSIEISARQGKRKYITRIRGLEEYGIDPIGFCKDVSRRFACSGAVETDPVGRAALKKGHVELVFQGHWLAELQALLLGDERLSSHGGAKDSDYCLPKTVIDVTLKKGVTAKKTK